jgi:predicted MPP superfamily phosphohydrolase
MTQPPSEVADTVAAGPALLAVARRVLHLLLTWSLRIALPLICANGLLRGFPYRAKVAGVPFRVQGTLFSRPGFTADTTLGSWEFPHVDGLPIGIHVSPENVDLLRLSRVANPDTSLFVDQLKSGFSREVPYIGGWLVGLTLLGIGIGLVLAAALSMAARYLRGKTRREHELRIRLHQLAGVAALAVAVGVYGAVSYNPDWAKQSRLTGTLGAVQLFPSQLEQYYNKQSKVYDVLGSVVGIQAALQAKIDQQNTPDTAYNIMYISDLHLAAVYPLVRQYVDNFDVKLIVSTGDESEFGTALELTPTYLASIARLTRSVPMIWLAGNHDSPEIERAMAGIKGVTVLGTKSRQADGSYRVSGSRVTAFGLSIAGIPDPRVYGAAGAAGAEADAVTEPLERAAMDAALAGVPGGLSFDIAATHEPSAANELTRKLPGRIRQTNSGHTHAQNRTKDLQSGENINLVEGSTGAGGLDNINRGTPAPPIEFSIESVTAACQFTKLLRFQLADPAAPAQVDAAAVRNDVTVSSVYLAPQQVPPARVCGLSTGVGEVRQLTAPVARTEGGG